MVSHKCVCVDRRQGVLSARDIPFCSLCSLVATGVRDEEGGGGKVSEETKVTQRGQRGRSGSGHPETCSVTHKLWQGHFTWRRYTLSDLSEWTILVTLFWSASKSKVDLNWLCRVGRCNLSPQCTLGPAICHTKPWHSLFYLHFKSDSTMNQTVIVSFMMTAKSFFSSSASKQTRRQIVGP